jgi:hypothetical protein
MRIPGNPFFDGLKFSALFAWRLLGLLDKAEPGQANGCPLFPVGPTGD